MLNCSSGSMKCKLRKDYIRLDCVWVRAQPVPMHLGLEDPLCPMSSHGSPVALLKLQIAPKLMLLISSGSKKKEPRCVCLSEAKASHSQRI
jgi:hypothetical protein